MLGLCRQPARKMNICLQKAGSFLPGETVANWQERGHESGKATHSGF